MLVIDYFTLTYFVSEMCLLIEINCFLITLDFVSDRKAIRERNRCDENFIPADFPILL